MTGASQGLSLLHRGLDGFGLGHQVAGTGPEASCSLASLVPELAELARWYPSTLAEWLSLVDVFMIVVIGLAAIPAVVLFIECSVAASVGVGRSRLVDAVAPPYVVLMPAHNEAEGLVPILDALRAQLREQDRVLVVADNCDDATAEIARAGGADVLERFDPSQRGKGFALTYGIDHLRKNPPDVVIVMDADCVVTAGTLTELAARCQSTSRPIQADYLLGVAKNAGFAGRISAFAVAVRSRARPLGLFHLGLPCQLLGSGMAFPWLALADAPEMGSALTEDLAMGFELALRGHAPRFCPSVHVSSRLPGQRSAAMSQRRRWEHGQLEALVGRAPRSVLRGLLRGRIDLVALGLDSMVPPLAFFIAILVVLVGMSGLWWVATGFSTALVVAAVELAMTGVAVGAAWLRFGREILSLRDFLGVPGYILSKMSIYTSFLTRRKQGEWVRTARDHERDDTAD